MRARRFWRLRVHVHGFGMRLKRFRRGLALFFLQRLQIVLHTLVVLIHRLREPPVLLLLLLRRLLVSLLTLRSAFRRLSLPISRNSLRSLESHNFSTARIPDSISIPRSSRHGQLFRKPSSLSPGHARRLFLYLNSVLSVQNVVRAVLFEHVFLRFHAFPVVCCLEVFASHGDFVRVAQNVSVVRIVGVEFDLRC